MTVTRAAGAAGATAPSGSAPGAGDPPDAPPPGGRAQRPTAWFTTLVGEVVAQRWRIARLAPNAWPGVILAAVVSLVRGVAPVAFALFVAEAVGRVPAALAGGLGSPAWHTARTLLIAAFAALAVQHVLEPVQIALGEQLARRVDGVVQERLMTAALRGEQIATLENPAVLDDLAEATRELEAAFRTPGAALAGLVALIARYVQLTGFAVLTGVYFSWWAAIALTAVCFLFRHGQRGGLRKYARVIRSVAHPGAAPSTCATRRWVPRPRRSCGCSAWRTG